MLKILVINRQKKNRVSKKRMALLGQFVLAAERKKNCSCSIVLLDDAALAGFHKCYLGKKEVTDVLSFPFDERDHDGTCYLGDVLVSVDRARNRASEYQNSFALELDLYVIHGLLHLLGYDDVGKHKRDIMKKKEHELWSAWRRLTDSREQKTENREQKTEDRGQRIESKK